MQIVIMTFNLVTELKTCKLVNKRCTDNFNLDFIPKEWLKGYKVTHIMFDEIFILNQWYEFLTILCL